MDLSELPYEMILQICIFTSVVSTDDLFRISRINRMFYDLILGSHSHLSKGLWKPLTDNFLQRYRVQREVKNMKEFMFFKKIVELERKCCLWLAYVELIMFGCSKKEKRGLSSLFFIGFFGFVVIICFLECVQIVFGEEVYWVGIIFYSIPVLWILTILFLIFVPPTILSLVVVITTNFCLRYTKRLKETKFTNILRILKREFVSFPNKFVFFVRSGLFMIFLINLPIIAIRATSKMYSDESYFSSINERYKKNRFLMVVLPVLVCTFLYGLTVMESEDERKKRNPECQDVSFVHRMVWYTKYQFLILLQYVQMIMHSLFGLESSASWRKEDQKKYYESWIEGNKGRFFFLWGHAKDEDGEED